MSDSLATEGTVRALKMAQKNRIYKNKALIHHSDRGLQYCSDEYQFLLKKYDIECSMTQSSDPYENAIAERVNGILKQEFSIDNMHLDLPMMRKVITEVIYIYNNQRPHLSNYMLTPNQMHLQQKIRYKTYNKKTVVSYCKLLFNRGNFIFINPVSFFRTRHSIISFTVYSFC